MFGFPVTIFSPKKLSLAAALFLATGLGSACNESVYPERPPQKAGPPIADPPSSKVVMHLTVLQNGLVQILEDAIPKEGQGTFSLVGERIYKWKRGPLRVSLDNSRQTVTLDCDIEGSADLPLTSADFDMHLNAIVQPVISADYRVLLQSPQVKITSEDKLLKTAEWAGGLLSTIQKTVLQKIETVNIDLRPFVGDAYVRLGQPLQLELGDASACAQIGVQGLEAGPTMLAGGFEKDLALVIAPSVTLPCTTPPAAPTAASMPLLKNVAALDAGPFSVVIPVAATYQELEKAAQEAFTNGKLYFSESQPNLYIEKPEVYASGGEVVVKVHLGGAVQKGLTVNLDGDLYLSGHPHLQDNELSFPDLKPTVETESALLKLSTNIGKEALQNAVRQALRLDISARLQKVRGKLTDSLSYKRDLGEGLPSVCVKTDVGRIEVTSIFAHDNYLRLYVQASAQTAAYVPCQQ